MLDQIIPYIDSQLSEFNQKWGLAEIISSISGESTKSFPAVYAGNGNYNPIDIEKGGCYHRIASQIITETIDQALFACTKGVQQIYPMVLIGLMKRQNDCPQFSTDTQANAIAAKLRQTIFTKQIRIALNVFAVDVVTTAINSDREQIWKQEYTNIPMAADFDISYFAVYYNIIIKADSSCMNLLEC